MTKPVLDPVTNFAKVVPSLVNSVTTQVTLAAGNRALLPDIDILGEFNLVWWNWTDYKDPSDDPEKEIVRVVDFENEEGIVIERAQEGTQAYDHNTSGKVYKMILAPTKKTMDDIETALTRGTAGKLAVVDADGFTSLDWLRYDPDLKKIEAALLTTSLDISFQGSGLNDASFVGDYTSNRALFVFIIGLAGDTYMTGTLINESLNKDADVTGLDSGATAKVRIQGPGILLLYDVFGTFQVGESIMQDGEPTRVFQPDTQEVIAGDMFLCQQDITMDYVFYVMDGTLKTLFDGLSVQYASNTGHTIQDLYIIDPLEEITGTVAAQEFEFLARNNTGSVYLRGPLDLESNYTLYLPSYLGEPGEFLTLGFDDGNYFLTWSSGGGGLGLAIGDNISSSNANQALYADSSNQLAQSDKYIYNEQYDIFSVQTNVGTPSASYGNVGYVGKGINDMTYTMSGFTGTQTTSYIIKIDGNGSPNTFLWLKDNVSMATNVPITAGIPQLLDDGIYITFASDTGHVANPPKDQDQFSFTITMTPEWSMKLVSEMASEGLQYGSFAGAKVDALNMFKGAGVGINSQFTTSESGAPMLIKYNKATGTRAFIVVGTTDNDMDVKSTVYDAGKNATTSDIIAKADTANRNLTRYMGDLGQLSLGGITGDGFLQYMPSDSVLGSRWYQMMTQDSDLSTEQYIVGLRDPATAGGNYIQITPQGGVNITSRDFDGAYIHEFTVDGQNNYSLFQLQDLVSGRTLQDFHVGPAVITGIEQILGNFTFLSNNVDGKTFSFDDPISSGMEWIDAMYTTGVDTRAYWGTFDPDTLDGTYATVGGGTFGIQGRTVKFGDFLGAHNGTRIEIDDVAGTFKATAAQSIFTGGIAESGVVSLNPDEGLTMTNAMINVLCKADTGTITIFLPPDPTNGQIACIKDVLGTGTYNVIINGNGNNIEGGVSSINMTGAFAVRQLKFSSVTGLWYIFAQA